MRSRNRYSSVRDASIPNASPNGQNIPPNCNILQLMVFGRAENVNLGRLTASGFSPMLSIGNVRQSVPCLARPEKGPRLKHSIGG